MLLPTVILVRPQLAQNVGSIARVMGNFGLTNLRIVSPREEALSDIAYASAKGFSDILSKAKIFPSFAAAVSDLTFLYATTSRPRHLEKITVSSQQAQFFSEPSGVVFGPENCGLNNEEISFCNKIIYIPTNTDPLNIAQAVAIICYEIHLKVSFSNYQAQQALSSATSQEVLMLLDHLENELGRRNFFQVKEKKKIMMNNIRSIFTRALLTNQEVQTLRGIIASLTKYSPKDV